MSSEAGRLEKVGRSTPSVVGGLWADQVVCPEAALAGEAAVPPARAVLWTLSADAEVGAAPGRLGRTDGASSTVVVWWLSVGTEVWAELGLLWNAADASAGDVVRGVTGGRLACVEPGVRDGVADAPGRVVVVESVPDGTVEGPPSGPEGEITDTPVVCEPAEGSTVPTAPGLLVKVDAPSGSTVVWEVSTGCDRCWEVGTPGNAVGPSVWTVGRELWDEMAVYAEAEPSAGPWVPPGAWEPTDVTAGNSGPGLLETPVDGGGPPWLGEPSGDAAVCPERVLAGKDVGPPGRPVLWALPSEPGTGAEMDLLGAVVRPRSSVVGCRLSVTAGVGAAPGLLGSAVEASVQWVVAESSEGTLVCAEPEPRELAVDPAARTVPEGLSDEAVVSSAPGAVGKVVGTSVETVSGDGLAVLVPAGGLG